MSAMAVHFKRVVDDVSGKRLHDSMYSPAYLPAKQENTRMPHFSFQSTHPRTQSLVYEICG
jgi:hypothetical protein